MSKRKGAQGEDYLQNEGAAGVVFIARASKLSREGNEGIFNLAAVPAAPVRIFSSDSVIPEKEKRSSPEDRRPRVHARFRSCEIILAAFQARYARNCGRIREHPGREIFIISDNEGGPAGEAGDCLAPAKSDL